MFIFSTPHDITDEVFIYENNNYSLKPTEDLGSFFSANPKVFDDFIKNMDKRLPGWNRTCQWGGGNSLKEAMEHFNKLHDTAYTWESDESWLPQNSAPGCKVVWFIAGIQSNRVSMPNGQSGFICKGRCKGFFPYAEANQPNGEYICFDCR